MIMKQFLLSTFFLFIAACSTTGQQAVPKVSELLVEQLGGKGRDCVRISDIKGYGYQHNVFTIDGRGDYYLATTVTRCHSMAATVGVVFQGPGNEVCGGGASKVYGSGTDCTISKVYEFPSRKEAFSALDKAVKKREELLQAAKQATRE
ncbi:hypothetical protein [Teredinibacter haidensis]|uniref:hypothetical protein n=1 Tax=Teredinibacter haidensis TaxID=2731755 RepID=UPI0009FAA783|nr:hypothetical protein [Teredinibacter haidensis]